MKQAYLVIYEQADNGDWGAHSPDVEGVYAGGSTREEVERLMAEAIAAAIEYDCEQGKPVPQPRTDAGRVAVDVPITAPSP